MRALRETAGYTVDSFAKAIEQEVEKVDVAGKVRAVEQGAEPLPSEWLRPVGALLRGANVDQVLDELTRNTANTSAAEHDAGQSARSKMLSELFADDKELETLSDAQFEKLRLYVEGSYRQAKAMFSE